jgi:PhoPQ-activated pathogenicity-related protein
MTSQQWRTEEEIDRVLWEHEMQIFVPLSARLAKNNTAILLIDGGSNGKPLPTEANEDLVLSALLTKSVVATVRQVPNQPLCFSDEAGREREEDEILAYSLDKYLDTEDEEWPVHLAMAKAAVRAMDTVQDFLQWRKPVDDFIVAGGSKRGWAAWLTAAVDPRVSAIIPLSIDIVNIRPQIRRHWEAYGFYSDAIADYVEFDLFCRMDSPEAEDLLAIIDPYEYRDRFTMDKFIINSAGDQFFLPDSSQSYFNDLPYPKLMRYTPNTDHRQSDEGILLSALSWVNDVRSETFHPEFFWTLEADGSIRVETVDKPKAVKLWQATNPDARDFRLETIGPAWTSTELNDTGDGVYSGEASPPSTGWTAYFVELIYHQPGVLAADQVYTTDVQVTPDGLPFEGTHCVE